MEFGGVVSIVKVKLASACAVFTLSLASQFHTISNSVPKSRVKVVLLEIPVNELVPFDTKEPEALWYNVILTIESDDVALQLKITVSFAWKLLFDGASNVVCNETLVLAHSSLS